MIRSTKMLGRAVALAMLCLMLAGCAANQAYKRGQAAEKREDFDRAVIEYVRALGAKPGTPRFSVALARARGNAAAAHFERAKVYINSGQLELAETELEQTIFLEPSFQYAENELQKVREEIRKKRMSPSEIEIAKEEARKKSLAPPMLSPRSNIPIVLNFKDQPLSRIFDALSKASGINFLYDERVDLKETKTVDLAGVTFEKAMDILMLQTKNFYKVIDENTILIAPEQRQKRQEYEDRVIRTFYLSNGDTKQVNTVLRQLLDARKVAENTQLNSLTIKDSPDVVAVAEKIIDANDKAKAELIIDVELVELNRSKLQELGIDLSTKALSVMFEGGDTLPLNDLNPIKQTANWSIGPIPGFILSFAKSFTDSKTIAKPQLRVTEGEKAEIHIGDRVPIPTTTFNTSNTIGGNIVPVTSFTYQNVGIEISVEPRVHHNKEITLKLNVTVSSISGTVPGTGGVSQPIIGERTITTVIRLKDGETNLLAGLIREEDRHSISGVPGLSDIPILNRLFGRNTDETQKLDIVLTLTPHIIRVPDIREEDLEPIWVGTEDRVQLRTPNKNPFGESPFLPVEEGGEAIAPRVEVSPSKSKEEGAEQPSAVQQDESQQQEQFEPDTGDDDSGDDDWDDEDWEDEDEDTGAPDASAQQPRPTLAQVILSAPKPIFQPGEQVVVQVRIANAQNVGSIPFHLRFNPTALEYVGPAIEGDFLNRDGAQTVFVATPGQPGELVVGASRINATTGASGSGVIASFTFVAREAGPAGFAFTGAAVRDPRASNLPASFSTAPVSVKTQ